MVLSSIPHPIPPRFCQCTDRRRFTSRRDDLVNGLVHATDNNGLITVVSYRVDNYARVQTNLTNILTCLLCRGSDPVNAFYSERVWCWRCGLGDFHERSIRWSSFTSWKSEKKRGYYCETTINKGQQMFSWLDHVTCNRWHQRPRW